MPKLTEDELLATVEREEANCIVHYTSLLSEQRRKAMQYYYGQPYGNEVEGRSQVVTTEVKDAVEGILPSLMAIFTSSEEIVRFEAQNPEDEQVAQQATDYINYIFSRLNNGFLALYCLFKDALLQKNGYVKVYWEEYEDVSKEHYEGLDDIEFQHLLNNDELELIEHTAEPETDQAAIQQAMQLGIQNPQKHEAVFRKTRKHGHVCVDPLPPEEVLISREAPNDLTKARFVEHRTLRTLSEIREMGYDVPDDIADYAPNADFNLERVERLKFDDALSYRQDADSNDASTKRVWLCEAYLKVDFDGDGIAELRKVTKVGKTVLDNEEFDSLPIIGGTAIPMPHKHYGLSIHDLMGDIQLQKSTVLRQLFDNAYVANNGRMEVLEGMVNMSDLLTSRPNGIVRVKALGAVKRIDNPLLGAPFYNLLEYLDKVGQSRTGYTGFPNAVDADAINAKAAFVDTFREAAQERIKLMARIFAETAVKDIFWKILELISKHQDKPRMVKLRGSLVQVDPREWKDRFHMTVTVGLGTGSQQTILNGMNMILGHMKEAAMMGLTNVVTPQNFYYAMHMAAKAVAPREADKLYTDPSTVPPPQPKPDPEMLKLQLQEHKQQMADMHKQQKMALDADQAEKTRQFQAAMEQFKSEAAAREQERKHQADLMKADLEARAQSQVAAVQSAAEAAANQQAIALQGAVDAMLSGVEHRHTQMEQALKGHIDVLVAKAKPKEKPQPKA